MKCVNRLLKCDSLSFVDAPNTGSLTARIDTNKNPRPGCLDLILTNNGPLDCSGFITHNKTRAWLWNKLHYCEVCFLLLYVKLIEFIILGCIKDCHQSCIKQDCPVWKIKCTVPYWINTGCNLSFISYPALMLNAASYKTQ